MSVVGIVGMIFALLITVFGWFMIPALSDILPIASLKAIFWIGIIIYWVLACIVTPILMITGAKGTWKGAILGLFSFIGGYVLSLVIYYTIGYILEAMESWAPNSTFLSIGWIVVYLIWVLGLIVVPAFLTIKDSLGKGKEE